MRAIRDRPEALGEMGLKVEEGPESKLPVPFSVRKPAVSPWEVPGVVAPSGVAVVLVAQAVEADRVVWAAPAAQQKRSEKASQANRPARKR